MSTCLLWIALVACRESPTPGERIRGLGRWGRVPVHVDMVLDLHHVLERLALRVRVPHTPSKSKLLRSSDTKISAAISPSSASLWRNETAPSMPAVNPYSNSYTICVFFAASIVAETDGSANEEEEEEARERKPREREKLYDEGKGGGRTWSSFGDVVFVNQQRSEF